MYNSHNSRIGRPTPPPPVPRGSFPPAPLPGRHRRPLPPPGPTSNKGYIDNPEEDYIQNISSRPSPFSHPPIGVSPFSNVHPMSRMPPLSGPENTDQEDYLTFDMPPALPHHKPSPAELKKKKHTPSYDDHALPSRPPPQPPRPQERTPSSRSDGNSPVTSRNTSVKDTSPFHYSHGNNRNTDGHSPVTSRPPSVKDMPPFHSHIPDRKHNRSTDGHSPVTSRPPSVKDMPPFHSHIPDRKHNRSTDGHSPVTSRPPSVKDMPPFHSHIPDRKHNRSTDSASSTSSDDLAMVPRPMVATSQSMPFNKPSKMPTRFPPTNRGAPNHTTAMMPPLEIVAPSKPAANTDLSKPTEDQPWFMNTGRDGAQRAIEGNKQNGIFVVRPKHESNYQPYALTLWASGTFKNLVIRRKPDGEFALGREKAGELSFKTVVAMIDYYQKHELNIADSSAITLISGP